MLFRIGVIRKQNPSPKRMPARRSSPSAHRLWLNKALMAIPIAPHAKARAYKRCMGEPVRRESINFNTEAPKHLVVCAHCAVCLHRL